MNEQKPELTLKGLNCTFRFTETSIVIFKRKKQVEELSWYDVQGSATSAEELPEGWFSGAQASQFPIMRQTAALSWRIRFPYAAQIPELVGLGMNEPMKSSGTPKWSRSQSVILTLS